MITRDEALARARAWAAEGRPEGPPEVELHEFELGWVAWPILAIEPAAVTDGPPLPPTSTGTPHVVVDRESGELSRWPSLPAAVIAEQYAITRAADDRFPADVRQMLDKAGWFPGRDVTAAVSQWELRFAEDLSGLTVFPVVRAALREFGGLVLPQYGRNGEVDGGFSTAIFPTRGGVGTDAARAFAEQYDAPVFPLGNNQDGPAEIVMDEQGRTFFLHWAGFFRLGTSLDEAVVALVRGGDWPELGDERTW